MFHVAIVDDLFDDDDDRAILDKFVNYIKTAIDNRGFVPDISEYTSATDLLNKTTENQRKRIDLYISDNNLEDGDNDGISFYTDLRKSFLCDFILYTQSGVDGIIQKIKKELDDNQDPSIFSRFTFVSRQNDKIWKSRSEDVIKHIITQREQFNNLRGLFAQSTSKIHTHLANLVLQKGEDARFQNTIEKAFKSSKIDSHLREQLHKVRLIRNALMHEDEKRCPETYRYFIEYSTPILTTNNVNESTEKQKIFETEQFNSYRQTLKSLEAKVLNLH